MYLHEYNPSPRGQLGDAMNKIIKATLISRQENFHRVFEQLPAATALSHPDPARRKRTTL